MAHAAIIEAVRATAARWPERVALVYGEERVSYAKVMERVDAVAAELGAKNRLQTPEREIVGLLCGNRAEFAYGLLGALAAGKTVAVLPTMAPPPLLAMMAAEAGVKRVLTTAEMTAKLAEAGVETALVERMVGSRKSEVRNQKFQIQNSKTEGEKPHVSSANSAERDVSYNREQVAVLLYTSGSTGRPKAVALSDANILANIAGCVAAAGFRDDEVMLAILPLFHAYGLTVTLLLPLVIGATVLLQERFAPRSALAAIQRHRATALVAVPSQYRLLAKEPTQADASSLRLCIAGAERLSETVAAEFAARFGKTILQGYGATEASPVISLNPPTASRAASAGKPLANTRVTIRENGRELGPHQQGEVCVEGPSVMLGYHNRPEATAEKVQDGVLRTGDQGWLDAEGYLHLAGRADDLIKVAGEKIYPAEVEQAIEQIAGVEEVAVIGVSDEVRGATLVAFVQPQPGVTLTEAGLRAACRGCVDGMKMPRSFVVMEQLPRTATGKLDKRALFERAASNE